MELTEKRKTIIIVAILAVIALVSIFLVSGVASSEESFTGTYSSLDAKRTTVTELMGVTAASSTAISLLPGDAGTPIADQLADLSGYFLFILAAICLEKWMVTISGLLAFRLIIPISCGILIAARILKNESWKVIGIKLVCFALMLFAIVPRWQDIRAVAVAYPITWALTAGCMLVYYIHYHKHSQAIW